MCMHYCGAGLLVIKVLLLTSDSVSVDLLRFLVIWNHMGFIPAGHGSLNEELGSPSPAAAGVGSPPEEGEMVVSPSPAGERLMLNLKGVISPSPDGSLDEELGSPSPAAAGVGSPDGSEPEMKTMLESSSPAGVGSPPEEGEMVVSPSPAGERLTSSGVEGSSTISGSS